MKTVSNTFAPFATSRKVDFEVEFKLLDTNAQTAAVPSASASAACSQLAQLKDDVKTMSGKYADASGIWRLDGTYEIMPDSLADIQTGWWSSEVSGVDGVFSSAPWVQFYFGGVAISTIGFTLFFDDKTGQHPTSIKVTTYGSDGTTVINQQTFTAKGIMQKLEFPSANYYYVKFEFLKTSEPYRRVRLCDVVFGIIQIFNKDSLQSANVLSEADVAAEGFASSELAFIFDNADHKYNLINPSGLYAYLQKGQDIVARAVIDGEKVEVGKFDFTRAEASDDELTATITANDPAFALDGQTYDNGSNTTSTLANALTAVLSGTGIAFSTTADSYTVSMAVPVGTTKREAVRLLAQAACCCVWFDRDKVLQVKPLAVSEVTNDILNVDRVENLGGIKINDPVGQVVLSVRNDFADIENTYIYGTSTPIKTVENPCVADANGVAVATWIYNQFNRRVRYEKLNRCNPAVEIADTLKIYDAYGENKNAVVTGIEINYDGGLSAITKAVRS